MQRPDLSTALAVTAFMSAAAIWIGIMAVQPRPAGLQASVIVMTKDIALVKPPPSVMELADLAR